MFSTMISHDLHHGGEIGTLRDLFRVRIRSTTTGRRRDPALPDRDHREHPEIVHPRATVDDPAEWKDERPGQRALDFEGEGRRLARRNDLLLLCRGPLGRRPAVAEKGEVGRVAGDPESRFLSASLAPRG